MCALKGSNPNVNISGHQLYDMLWKFCSAVSVGFSTQTSSVFLLGQLSVMLVKVF